MSPASVVVRLVAVIAFGYWAVTYGADAVGALSQLVGGGSQRPNPTFGVLCMLGGLASLGLLYAVFTTRRWYAAVAEIVLGNVALVVFAFVAVLFNLSPA